MVAGLFRDRESAERAYHAVAGRGYNTDDVNLVMSDETRARHFSNVPGDGQTVPGTKAGAGIGAIGGTLGAIAAAIVAVGTTIAIPGLALVIAGPIVAAGAGAATGGLVGALTGWGIPEERIKRYEAGVRNGGILMGVKTHSDDEARTLGEEWQQHRGEDVYW
jgi:hypothetical protein